MTFMQLVHTEEAVPATITTPSGKTFWYVHDDPAYLPAVMLETVASAS
jgi:hypothetical protein